MKGNSVSVVIPAFNAAGYIREALGSVSSQDWPADEVIIVNDGSTDMDYRCLAGGNVRVVTQENKGVSAARNTGYRHATGDYIAILDADDVWVPGKLRSQMSYLRDNPDCDAIFTDGVFWDGVEKHARRIPATANVRGLNYEEFLLGIVVAPSPVAAKRSIWQMFGIIVAPSTMVVKRRIWQMVGGFDEGMRYGEDQDFYLRLAHKFRVAKLEAEGVLYRRHPGSATQSSQALQGTNHHAEVLYRAIHRGQAQDVDQAKLKRRLAQLHLLHGYAHYWYGDRDIARRQFRLALRKRITPKALVYCLLTQRGPRRKGSEQRLSSGF